MQRQYIRPSTVLDVPVAPFSTAMQEKRGRMLTFTLSGAREHGTPNPPDTVVLWKSAMAVLRNLGTGDPTVFKTLAWWLTDAHPGQKRQIQNEMYTRQVKVSK
jgi:hypothetical protein